MRKLTLLLTMLALAAGGAIQAQEAATSGAFRVDSDASWLRVLAYPDGPLKRFGHHHVIAHHGFSGTVNIAPDPLESSFMLQLIVADFAVDDPEMRALEGEDFEDEVPQDDVEGTKANMLGEDLLNGAQFPTIEIRSSAIEGSMPEVHIVTTVTVTGVESTVTFPATIELSDDSFVARGELDITHGELGISPFTAMGGALSVRDVLVLKYEIAGSRIAADE